MAAICLSTVAAQAASWQTVDDFQYSLNEMAHAWSMVASSNGIIYVMGNGEDATGHQHTLLQASGDGGSTWSLVNDFASNDGARVAVTIDPAGNIYQSGSIIVSGVITWYTRQSADGGHTWNVVDQFSLGGKAAIPEGIATDSAGNVYVVGFSSAVYNGYWMVRKGTPGLGGMTWTTVDQITGTAACAASGVAVHPTAGVLVTGQANGVWTTRRSGDGGATWQTVDSFQLGSTAGGDAISLDALGNIYAAGNAEVVSRGRTQYSNGIVRKSSDGGTTWTTIDNFATSGANNLITAFASDANGNLYAVGRSTVALTGIETWIVRESVGGTGVWTTVDSYQLASGKTANAQTIDSALGQVLVGGWATDAGGSQHWIIRRLTP